MEQDGRLDTSPGGTASCSTNAHEGGTVLMTLYTAFASGTALRHATVPFPQTYEAACQQALKVFAVYIPEDTETVSLRHAYKKLDGNVVWSAVHEDDWSAVLKKMGEEIGVFLPDETPDEMPYDLPGEKLVRINPYGELVLLRAVRSFEECKAIAQAAFDMRDDKGLPRLMYDARMTGSAESRDTYRRESETVSILQNAKWEEIYTRELFKILVDMHPEPLVIKIL